MRFVRIIRNINDSGRLLEIANFPEKCRKITTLDQLGSVVDAIVRQFGFRWFALVHNVDLKRTTRKALLITTYPANWIEEIMDARLYLEDPAPPPAPRPPPASPGIRSGTISRPTLGSCRSLNAADHMDSHLVLPCRSGCATSPMRCSRWCAAVTK